MCTEVVCKAEQRWLMGNRVFMSVSVFWGLSGSREKLQVCHLIRKTDDVSGRRRKTVCSCVRGVKLVLRVKTQRNL